MSTIRVEVNPEVILDAVAKSSRSIDEVEKKFSSFHKWIENQKQPTFNQLNALSKFLRIPFGYLLLKSPVKEDLPLLEFRTIETESIQNPSRELIDTINDMESKQQWLREAFIEEGKDNLDFVGMFKEKNNNAEEFAKIIRETINLNKTWYKSANSRTPTFSILREKLSQAGIVIMQNGTALNNTRRPLDIKEFRAFTLVDEYAPLIFINNLDSNSGKTFSLLHETAHIFFGQNSLYNDDFKNRNRYLSSIEVICNEVAGEIITPTDLFIDTWKKKYKDLQNDIDKIENAANEFKVSKLIIARKALEQKFINHQSYTEIAKIVQKEYELSQKRRKQLSGGNPTNNAISRLDNNFLRTLITNTEYGDIQYTEAYRLAGIGRGTFEDVSERLKGVR